MVYNCTAGFLWRLRLWSNRRLHAHGKGYEAQSRFRVPHDIPCYVLVDIYLVILGRESYVLFRYWNKWYDKKENIIIRCRSIPDIILWRRRKTDAWSLSDRVWARPYLDLIT